MGHSFLGVVVALPDPPGLETDVVLVAVSDDQATIAMAAGRASAIRLARALAEGAAQA